MKDKPLVSIVMSVFNSEKYLNLCIESILNQTLKDYEFLIIDDNSSDGSWEILLNYSKNNQRIHLFKNNKNLGLTRNLNFLITKSSGQFIARMDSDDIATTNRLQVQLRYLEMNKHIDILGSFIEEFENLPISFNSKKNSIVGFPVEHRNIVKTIPKRSPLAHPTVVFKREVFDVISYNENYRTSQDIDLWFQAIFKGFKLGNVPEVLLYYRKDDQFLKRRSLDKAINEFQIYSKGIRKLDLNYYLHIYPFLRLIFRISPRRLQRFFYNRKFRNWLSQIYDMKLVN